MIKTEKITKIIWDGENAKEIINAVKKYDEVYITKEITLLPKLKPCPFCGGKAELFERSLSDKATGKWDVRCMSDNCYLEDGSAWYFGTKEEAREVWNNRLTKNENIFD